MTRDELLQSSISRYTLREWDKRWEPLPNALITPHPELTKVIGLIMFKWQDEIAYIARATEPKGGIAKGLRRIMGPDQTGNRSYGAQMIRQHADSVSVLILRVDDPIDRSAIAKKLKIAMNKLHEPKWAHAHRKRMADIRAGKIKAR